MERQRVAAPQAMAAYSASPPVAPTPCYIVSAGALMATIRMAASSRIPHRRFGGRREAGADGYGTLWSFAGGVLTTLHSFASNTDLAIPLQGPELNAHGVLFGSAATGTANNNGGIFQLKPNGDYKILYGFLSGKDGHCPLLRHCR
jgi:hypothetical protein